MNRNIITAFVFLFSSTLFAYEKESAIYESINDSLIVFNDIQIVGRISKSIPGSGFQINQSNLAKINQPNINAVLRTMPGVNVRDEEGFGLRPNIGLRGTSVNRSARITLMEDGVLIAPAPYADPSAYYFPTFARMQAVEILKGSSQVKYGPYTIGGALNLISTAIPDRFRTFAQLSYGSFNTNQQRVWVGDNKDNFDYVVEFNRYASDGFKQLDNNGKTGFDRRDVMGKFRWHSSADAQIQQSLTLKLLNSTETGNETYLGLSFDDFMANPFRRYAATQRDLLEMTHNHISLNYLIRPTSGLTINTTAYYSNTFRDWARASSAGGQSVTNIINDPETHELPYRIMTGQADGVIEYQSAARNYIARGIQANARYVICTNSFSSKIELGMRYHEDQADRLATRSIYNMTNGTMILTTPGVDGNRENQIRKASSLAAYFNYEFIVGGLKINPGVRYEKIDLELLNYGTADNARIGTNLKTADNQVSVFLPGMGVNYDLNSNMNVFAGVYKGFSPPGTPTVNENAAQAIEETATNYEVGYRVDTRNFNAQFVGFINNYNNILGSDNISGGGAGTGDMFNAGRAIVKGLEANMTYDLLSIVAQSKTVRLPLTVAYTYTEAKFDETFVNGGGDWGSGLINKGDFIPFITPHLLTSSLGFENQKMNITVTSRYIGLTRVKPGQAEIVLPAADVKVNDINALASNVTVDLSANYFLNKTLTVYCNLSNLGNNVYIMSNLPQGYRPNMPFNVVAGLKLNL